MATDNQHLNVTCPAGAVIGATNLYRAVKMDSSGRVILCTALGEAGIGVLYSTAAAVGDPVEVVLFGVVKARAGAAMAEGVIATVQADGDFETSLTGDREWGTVLTEATAAGDIIQLLLGWSQNITA